VPRDEVVVSLEPKPEREKADDDILIDLSGLELDNNNVEAGVTSGADPSSWDPIDVDKFSPESSCVEEGGKSGGKSAAVCQSQEQQSPH
jgi:hypothetical protein